MLELHQTLHAQYGICLWTLLALIVFLIMVVIFILHLYRQSRREYKFEKKLEENAGNAKPADNGQEVE